VRRGFDADGLRKSAKFFEDRIKLYHRTYLPLIEEHTYGRESLDVGFGFPEYIISMRERGWLADGIDIVQNDYITGDFETYDFKGKKYDLIILSHAFASFEKPYEALVKVHSLLRKGGLLWMMAPDTSLCLELGYAEFGHWNYSNKHMTSLEGMVRELTKVGFDHKPLVSIQNQSKRFAYYNDYHLIMKKGLI
jgi:predicted SAM-dependent methyltransferase